MLNSKITEVVDVRTLLSEFECKYVTLTGTFVRFGECKNSKVNNYQTILVTDVIMENGKYACNHLWIKNREGIIKEDIKFGDIVEMYGIIARYRKEKDFSTELGLTYCKSIYIVERQLWKEDEGTSEDSVVCRS